MHTWRQADFGSGCQFGLRVTDRIPPDQRLHCRNGRFGDHGHHTARPARPNQGGRRHPAPQRVLGRAQVLTAQQRPAIQQQRRPIPAGRPGFGSWSGDHQGWAGVELGHQGVAGRRNHRRTRECPAELFGSAPGPHHHGTHHVRPTAHASQCRVHPSTPATYRTGRAGALQR
ncbi:Uncharacterised protein [Mycobacterium tuberculosis]|nr:Uncharacterised protein [Mycobacterium tuberculosis]